MKLITVPPTQLLLALLLASPAWSQEAVLPSLDPSLDLNQYVHDVWRTQDGLPHDAVSAIVQTRDGYVWLGTLGGLVRFDGVAFTRFSAASTPAFQGNFVSALLESVTGELWIGFRRGGLVRYSAGRFVAVTVQEGLPHRTVYTLFEDRAGILWIGTEGGLASLEGGRLTTHTWEGGVAGTAVEAITGDGGEGLWIATRFGGVTHLEGGVFTSYDARDGLTHDNVSALMTRADGTLWIGTEGGEILRFTGGSFEAVDWSDPDRRKVNTLFEDRAGSVWVGTDGGALSRIVEGHIGTLGPEDGFSDDRVLSLAEGRDGSLWIGTQGGGLNRLKSGRFIPYTTRQGLSDDQVVSVHEGPSGTIWVGSRRGVDRLGETGFEHVPLADLPSSAAIAAIYVDRAGLLWLGTSRGLFSVEDGRGKRYGPPDGLGFSEVQAILQDRSGDLWIGTRAGVIRLRGGTFEWFTTRDGLPTNSVIALYEDTGGILWVGTEGGLARRGDQGFVTIEGPTAVQSFYEGEDGVLWLGTVGEGLYRLRDGVFTLYTTADGLHDDDIGAIFGDRDGYLWMCSGRGVFTVREDDLEEYAVGRSPSVRSRPYGVADGMKSPECARGRQPSAWLSGDSTLWIPTRGGVVRMNDLYREMQSELPIYIEQVLRNGEPVDQSERVTLVAGTHELRFNYTALGLRNPQLVTFRYRLEGYDDEWIEAGTRRWAVYTNPPPGPYRFRVAAARAGGEWAQDEAELAFSMAAFFYQTVWFRAIALAILVLGLLGAHRVRTQRMRSRNRELEEQIVERKAAQASLDAQSRELTHILDSVSPQIWFLDENARVIRCNEAARRAIGRSEEELRGKSIAELAPKWDDPELRHHQSIEAIRTGEPQIGSIESQAGQRWVSVDRIPSRSQTGEVDGLLLVVYDITDMRAADEKRRILEQQLYQAQKLETIGTLTAGIAHDFNNVLVPILGFTNMVRSKAAPGGQVHENLGWVVDAAERARGLVHRMLTFSRQVDPDRRPVELAPIVSEAVRLLRASLPATIEILETYTDGGASILADPGQIHQIVMNLGTNALHAMRESGGVLEVAVERTQLDGELAQRHPLVNGVDAVRMTVRDSGQGMAPEVAERIFEPFFTTKGVGEGSGLGLSVIQGIVASHDGVIRLKSEPGQGTTFTLDFLVSGAHRNLATLGDDAPTKGHGRILVVDDEKPIVVLAERILQRLGYTVDGTTSSEEALSWLRSRPDDYDLVITDQTMPRITGLELAAELNDIRTDLPLILATGFSDAEVSASIGKDNVRVLLRKPFSPAELGQAAQAAMRPEGTPAQ